MLLDSWCELICNAAEEGLQEANRYSAQVTFLTPHNSVSIVLMWH